jgi:hypothetical protein
MEKTFKDYRSLPKPLRDQCLDSIQKFANMSAYERAQFLHNAEHWKTMSATERQTWRNLVNKFPPMPPSPPGMRVVPEPPPLPSSVGPSATRVSTVAAH